MARRYNIPLPAPRKPEQPQHTCRDCSHSYGWRNKGINGMTLCYCPFHKEGKFCKLLSDRACVQFNQRTID